MPEDVLGHGAHLAIAEDLLQTRGRLLELHGAGGQQALALQDHVLPSGVDHRRDFAVGHVEHRVFDLLVAAVLADRIDHALGACAGGVFGVVLGQVAEILRLGCRLGLQLPRFLQTADGDQAGANRLAILNLKLLDQLLARDRKPFAGDLSQRQRGPNDVVGILFRRNVPLLLEHLEPLVDGNAEPLRHALDFGVHVGPGNADPLPLALLDDQLFVDHALEHFRAVGSAALAGELLARDPLGVDRGHHRRGRRFRSV